MQKLQLRKQQQKKQVKAKVKSQQKKLMHKFIRLTKETNILTIA